MTAKDINILKARIKEDLDSMEILVLELRKRGIIKNGSNSCVVVVEEDNFILRALGSILHDFYVAVESIFKIISVEIDESVPEGLDWHLKLLKQMVLEISGIRPPVISRETWKKLDKYRAFRHVFRNVYGFNLDSIRLKELLQELPTTIARLSQDIELFIKQLEIITAEEE